MVPDDINKLVEASYQLIVNQELQVRLSEGARKNLCHVHVERYST
jgi:hypothetical protein